MFVFAIQRVIRFVEKGKVGCCVLECCESVGNAQEGLVKHELNLIEEIKYDGILQMLG